MQKICNECGGLIVDVDVCRDYLNKMIVWDFEDFSGVGQIHHLTVLCYQLQHPSSYSQRGLEDAKSFLVEFVDKNVSFEEHDKRNREKLSSAVRNWKITGTHEDHGKYKSVVDWKITAGDVVQAGLSEYVENVKKWSRSILNTLRESGNLS